MFKMLSALTVLLLITVGAIKIISSQGNGSSKQDDATPITVGDLTPRQKVHSKIFDKYKTGRKLDAPQPGNGQSEDSAYVEPPIEVSDPSSPVQTFTEFMGRLSCESDAVAIVEIKDKASQLTENREFVFSDYRATVIEVLKNNNAAPLAPNGPIEIARPGGKVMIGTRVVGALDSSFEPLSVNNSYLLFLNYIPATGAYTSVRKGSFLLSNNELTKLTKEYIPGGKTQTITTDVRYSIENCVQRKDGN